MTTNYHLEIMYHLHEAHGFPAGKLPDWAGGETWETLHDELHAGQGADHTHEEEK